MQNLTISIYLNSKQRTLLLLITTILLAVIIRYLSNGSLDITELHYCALFSVFHLAIVFLLAFAEPWLQLCGILSVSEVRFYLVHLASYLLYFANCTFKILDTFNQYKARHSLIFNPALSSFILQAMETSTAFIPEI